MTSLSITEEVQSGTPTMLELLRGTSMKQDAQEIILEKNTTMKRVNARSSNESCIAALF